MMILAIVVVLCCVIVVGLLILIRISGLQFLYRRYPVCVCRSRMANVLVVQNVGEHGNDNYQDDEGEEADSFFSGKPEVVLYKFFPLHRMLNYPYSNFIKCENNSHRKVFATVFFAFYIGKVWFDDGDG